MVDSAHPTRGTDARTTAETTRTRQLTLMMFSRLAPCSRSWSRMERAMDFTQVSPVEVGVDRGGGDGSMTQRLLDHAQVGPALQQVRRERVTQGMRVHPSGQARLAHVPPQDLPEP